MSEQNKTIKLLIKKEKEKALYVAAKRIFSNPSDPTKYLNLLMGLAEIIPEKLPLDYAEYLLKYFINTSNFSSALAVLVYMGKSPQEQSDELLNDFLTAFSGKQSGGFAPPPMNQTEYDETIIEIPENLTFDVALETALEAVSTIQEHIFLPPPMPPRQIPLFHMMSFNSLVKLLREGEIFYFDEGDFIMKQGDKDDSFYILVQGVLQVSRKIDRVTTKLGVLRSGSFFGEMALVTNSTRSASIMADTPSVVLKISWNLLNSMLSDDPDLAKELARYTRYRLLKNLMATSPLFKLLPPESKGEIMSSFKPYIAQPGEFIVKEGSLSKGLFMVASGEVSVFTGSASNMTFITTLKPGEVFGEISLIRESNATATVKSDSNGTVLMLLTREVFQKLAIRHPEFLSHIYQVALDRSEQNKEVASKEIESAEDLIL